jgi:hypothetical protein
MKATVPTLTTHLVAAVRAAFARQEGEPIYVNNNEAEGWSVISTAFAGDNARVVITCKNHDALAACKEAFRTSHISAWVDLDMVAMIPGI